MSRIAIQVLNLVRRFSLRVRFIGKRVYVHPSSWLSFRSSLDTRGGGQIRIGRQCEIHPYSMILTYGGRIQIGDNCSLNPFAIIYGHGGVRIGNGVRIAAHVVIIPAQHVVSDDGRPFHESGVIARGVDIGDNVWLGAGAVVLDGVRIGPNAIVGAGSVVTKSVSANTTVAGVPAREIALRQPASVPGLGAENA